MVSFSSHKLLKYLTSIIILLLVRVYTIVTATSLTLGTVDTTFNPDINHGNVFSIAMMPNGDVMFGGSFSHFGGATSSGGITRYRLGSVTSTGLLTNFDVGVNGWVYTLSAQIDGKLIVGGSYSNIGNTSQTHLARLTTTGLWDSGFKANFTVNNAVRTSLVQPDGSVVLGGDFSHPYAGKVVRLSTTGLYLFANNYSPDPNSSVRSLALQPNGLILFGGVFGMVNDSEITMMRIGRATQTGNIDTSFSGNIPGISPYVYTIAVEADGKILIGGTFTTVGGQTRNYIARLSHTGLVDPSFNPNVNNVINDIEVQSDGKILIGGMFTGVGGTQITGFARLTTTGLLDNSLNVNIRSNVNGVNAEVFAIALDPTEGSVVIGGAFNTVGGLSRNRAARIGLAPPCGDGIINSGETCDDGNTNSNDGCSNVCMLETPSCTFTPTVSSGFINTLQIGFTGVVLNTGGIITNFSNFNGQGIGGSWTGFRYFGPYTVNVTGNRTATLTVANVYSGSITNTCVANFTSYATGITIGGCGDGVIQGGEQCDDRNANDADGCSSSCQLESPSCVVTATPQNMSVGTAAPVRFTGANGAHMTSRTIKNMGNGPSGGGPSSIAGTTYTFNASGTYFASGTATNPYSGSMKAYCSITGTVYANICGNGFLQGAEQCDDNNATNGDGCSSTCTLETPSCTIAVSPNSGYTPLLITAYGTGSSFGIFTNILWSDSIVYTGNRTGTVQTGYTYNVGGAYTVTGIIASSYSGNITNVCSANFSLTTPACGDGVIHTGQGEQCDDGNTNNNDACSSSCQLEMPSCSLIATPNNGTIPLIIGLTGLANNGGLFTGLAWDGVTSGTDSTWTGYISTGYSYLVAGSYTVTGTVANPYSGSMMAMCSATVTATAGGGGPVRVIPTDSCPNGDYSPTPYDGQCGTPPNTGNGGGNTVTTGATVVTGTTNTGSTSTGMTFTGTDAPSIPELPLEPEFPALPLPPSMEPNIEPTIQNLYTWAKSYGITTLSEDVARPLDTVLRYELAKMLVNFAENVMRSRIPHNPLCAVETYGDYASFDTEMQEHITKVCDLGLMGRSIRNVKILDLFRPFDTLSVEELNIVMERYLGYPVNVQSNNRKDIREFMMNAQK